MRFGVARPLLALGSLLAAACGGATRSDLVSDDPGFGNLPDAAAPSDASVPTDAGAPPRTDSGAAGGDGGLRDAASPADGGAVVVDSGVVVVDAGRDAGPLKTFRCGAFDAGAIACAAGTEDCCADIPSTSGRATFTCQARGDCSGSEVAIECANSADCAAGSVCCGFFSQTYGWDNVSCLAPAQCVGNATQQAILMCNPYGVNSCPTGRSCQASSRLTGYGYCQ